MSNVVGKVTRSILLLAGVGIGASGITCYEMGRRFNEQAKQERLQSQAEFQARLGKNTDDFRKELQEANKTIQALKKGLVEERKKEILRTAARSAVMLQAKYAEGKVTVWTGAIIKDNNNEYYVLSCGHTADSPDYLKYPVTMRLYNNGFYDETPRLTFLPSALKNKKLPWLPHKEGDIMFMPLPGDVVKKLPSGIGLKVADTTKKLEAGQDVCIIGNPFGLSNSVYWTTISNPDRRVRFNEDTNFFDVIQLAQKVPEGISGAPVIDLDGELVGVAIVTYNDEIGFALNPKGIKGPARRFDIPLISQAEMLQEIKDNQTAFLLFGQAHPYGALNVVPLLEFNSNNKE